VRGAQALVDWSPFRYRTPLGGLVTYGPGNMGRRDNEGDGKTERPGCGGAPARHGLKRRRAPRDSGGGRRFKYRPGGHHPSDRSSTAWIQRIRESSSSSSSDTSSRGGPPAQEKQRGFPFAGEDGRRRSDRRRVWAPAPPSAGAGQVSVPRLAGTYLRLRGCHGRCLFRFSMDSASFGFLCLTKSWPLASTVELAHGKAKQNTKGYLSLSELKVGQRSLLPWPRSLDSSGSEQLSGSFVLLHKTNQE
jgi:hypothetical protein